MSRRLKTHALRFCLLAGLAGGAACEGEARLPVFSKIGTQIRELDCPVCGGSGNEP